MTGWRTNTEVSEEVLFLSATYWPYCPARGCSNLVVLPHKKTTTDDSPFHKFIRAIPFGPSRMNYDSETTPEESSCCFIMGFLDRPFIVCNENARCHTSHFIVRTIPKQIYSTSGEVTYYWPKYTCEYCCAQGQHCELYSLGLQTLSVAFTCKSGDEIVTRRRRLFGAAHRVLKNITDL